MTQLSYTASPPVAVNGMLASTRIDNTKLARAAEGTVNFGYLVTRGTNPATQVTAVTAAADISDDPVGIIVNTGDTQADNYADGKMVNVLRKGHILATCATAFTAGGTVYATNATGAIRSNATGGTAIPNAVFLSTGGAGALAEIEFDLLGQ